MLVYYRIFGQGKLFLLLYGMGVLFYIWDGWMMEFQDSFQLIVVDLFVFGFMGLYLEWDYSILVYVDFVKDVVDELVFDLFVLVGNLLGGLIVWVYIVKYLEKVMEFVLLDVVGLFGVNVVFDKLLLLMCLV